LRNFRLKAVSAVRAASRGSATAARRMMTLFLRLALLPMVNGLLAVRRL